MFSGNLSKHHMMLLYLQSLDLDMQLASHKTEQPGVSGQMISLYDIPALTRALQLMWLCRLL